MSNQLDVRNGVTAELFLADFFVLAIIITSNNKLNYLS
jgi:hypothetical protein